MIEHRLAPRHGGKGGEEQERGTALGEMVAEVGEDPSRDRKAVPPAVQGEVRPGVRVPLRRAGREVRRVGEDPLEPSQPSGQVRSDDGDREPMRARRMREPSEGRRVSVGRDDRPAGPGRGEAEFPAAAPDLEQSPGAPLGRERTEQLGVLARRIDARPGLRRRETVGS